MRKLFFLFLLIIVSIFVQSCVKPYIYEENPQKTQTNELCESEWGGTTTTTTGGN